MTEIRNLPQRLTQAIRTLQTAFDEHNLTPPLALVVDWDIQCMLIDAGVRPVMGSWGTIEGIEIRGVWGGITEAMRKGQSFADLKETKS